MQVIFDISKAEAGNPGSNLKKFAKKYKEFYKVHYLLIIDWFEQGLYRIWKNQKGKSFDNGCP